MNSGRHVLAQLLDFVQRETLSRLVSKYSAESKVRHFGVRQQLICMAFAQLTWRNGLRDIEACLNSKPEALYHLGFQEPVAKSTLADANEKRDWRLWEDLAKSLINRARNLYQGESLGLVLDNTVYALDTSTIDLTMLVFPWAKFRSTKSGNKLHTQLDLREPIPVCIYIFEAKVNDIKWLDELIFEPRAICIMDRGYIDWARLFQIASSGAFFVIRAKDNLRFTRYKSQPVDKSTGLRSDQIGKLSILKSKGDFPTHLRRVRFYDEEKQKHLVFPNKQLANSCLDCGEALQKAMGDRVIFQVDQRQLGNQALLLHKRQRGEDTNLDSGIAIFDSGHHSQKPKTRPSPQ